jgi:transposase
VDPSDLSDAEWAILAPLIPPPSVADVRTASPCGSSSMPSFISNALAAKGATSPRSIRPGRRCGPLFASGVRTARGNPTYPLVGSCASPNHERLGGERTFAWLTPNRHLCVEYDQWPASSEARVYLAMSRLLTTRLARSASP